jgi:hypothetical protein
VFRAEQELCLEQNQEPLPAAESRTKPGIKFKKPRNFSNTRVYIQIDRIQHARTTRTTCSQHSIPTQKYKNTSLMSTLLPAKHTKKKSLPPRGIGGWFVKKMDSTAEPSESTSGNSSPLDTPEINKRALIDHNASASEHEVNE